MVCSLRWPPEYLATRAANALSTGRGSPLAKVSVIAPAGAASGLARAPAVTAHRREHRDERQRCPAPRRGTAAAGASSPVPHGSAPLRNHEPSLRLWASPRGRL